MSANRSRFHDAIVAHQNQHHRFEHEQINNTVLSQRQAKVNEYFTNNQARFSQHPKLKHKQHRKFLKDVMLTTYARDLILICIDVEYWEHGRDEDLLEVGIAIFDPRGQQTLGYPHIKTYHLINEDNLHLANGDYVPDNRDYFMGKQLWKMPLALIISFVQGVFDYYYDIKGWDAVLVGHAVHSDIRVLENLGIDVPDKWTIDTQKLFALSRTKNSQTNLRVALRETHILGGHLHNGANDAYLTLQLVLKLGDPEVRTILDLDRFESPYNPVNKGPAYHEMAHQATFSNPIPYQALLFAFPEPDFDIDRPDYDSDDSYY